MHSIKMGSSAAISNLISLIIVAQFIGTVHSVSHFLRDVGEFCQLETFNASCPLGTVIMMQKAHYGRMRVGRCLATSYFVGCYADVLPFMDARCSGKRTCDMSVLDSELVKFQPCRTDLMAYLEASYTCIKVPMWSPDNCARDGNAVVEKNKGYIPFRLGRSVHPGTESCPWQVDAEPGQRIEFDLFSFLSWRQRGETMVVVKDTPCKYTLVFLDGEKTHEVTMYIDRHRDRHIYTSDSNKVQVFLKLDTNLKHHARHSSILLHYEPIGCADIDPIPDANIIRSDNTAVVACKKTQETWELVCQDNNWIGDIRNCSEEYVKPNGKDALQCPELPPIDNADIMRTDTTAIVRCKGSTETVYLVCKNNEWIGDIKNCSAEKPYPNDHNPKVTKTSVMSGTTKYKWQYGIVIAVAIGLILGLIIGSIFLVCMLIYKKCKCRKSKDCPSCPSSVSSSEYQRVASLRDPRGREGIYDMWLDVNDYA